MDGFGLLAEADGSPQPLFQGENGDRCLFTDQGLDGFQFHTLVMHYFLLLSYVCKVLGSLFCLLV